MRIDKYLWCTRYFKTRNMATNSIKKGNVKVNGQVVKPGREVYATDQITVRKNQINHTLTVLDVPKSRVGAKLVDMYRKDTTPAEAFEHTELLQYSKEYYRKRGTGRPTKKDRREIEDYMEHPTEGMDSETGEGSEASQESP
ncbi:RNA-binding S4 domain-containing protein [Maribacter sp. 2307ULW6-5]|uniref:RNA-binding S4 domain-containing protein n=1 Tax=Maribacter sp. 2307ULW6-5 TaxID=3386275 RepID=UPI0039BC3791